MTQTKNQSFNSVAKQQTHIFIQPFMERSLPVGEKHNESSIYIANNLLIEIFFFGKFSSKSFDIKDSCENIFYE